MLQVHMIIAYLLQLFHSNGQTTLKNLRIIKEKFNTSF